MALPLILGVAAVALAGTGVKKGFDAQEKNEKAKRVVKRAKRKFKEAKEELELERRILNKNLEDYAKLKLEIFTSRIKNLLKILECQKSAKSKLNHEILFTDEQIKNLQATVDNSYEILTGLSKGALSGSLTALGAYGMVGLLAEASTGTAIASLGGAAATNATLAWLGGGSLAAGGFGMAGGMMVLSGLVAGPAIAITGFVMDSKAEENLTEAWEFDAEVDENIEKMQFSIEGFEVIRKRINEIKDVLNRYVYNFDTLYMDITTQDNICENEEKIEKLMTLGKGLKNILEISLLNRDGNTNENSLVELKKITQEYHI